MNPKIDRAKVMELAERHVRTGRLEDAIAEYRKLLEGEAPDISVNNTIGDLFLRLNQTDRAIYAFKEAADDYENRDSIPRPWPSSRRSPSSNPTTSRQP